MGYAVSDTQYLYILGGQDLNKGIHNDLWRLNLQTVRDNIRNAQWEQVIARGDPPKQISHCCCFIYQSKLFVFGGTQDTNVAKKRFKKADSDLRDLNKPHMFNVLNLTLMQWSVWRENDIPEVDDFAHVFD